MIEGRRPPLVASSLTPYPRLYDRSFHYLETPPALLPELAGPGRAAGRERVWDEGTGTHGVDQSNTGEGSSGAFSLKIFSNLG
jgi:hypothetical protein